MASIQDILNQYSDDISAVDTFCAEMYDNMFNKNFAEVHKLYVRLQSDRQPITDPELEYVLTTFPLELFVAAESLNKLRLHHETTKLKNKEKAEQFRREACKEASSLKLNKSETSEFVSRYIGEKMVEYDILLSAYNSVISRVENELSFSRELIMGCKKIWDSRRNAEQMNPVGPISPSSARPSGAINPPRYIK